VEQAQQALDVWVHEYNHSRPHQGLDGQAPVSPTQRFAPTGHCEQDLLPL
jgi:transposase InsO family protein